MWSKSFTYNGLPQRAFQRTRLGATSVRRWEWRVFCSSARQLSRFRRRLSHKEFVFSITYDWSFNCVLRSTVVMSTRSQMLRITRKANGEVVFRVSGQLTAENVTEMVALIAAETKGRRIVLDCTDLRSVDGEAVKFLEKWEADSIKLKNCGLYIREWIRRERLERESDQSSDK